MPPSVLVASLIRFRTPSLVLRNTHLFHIQLTQISSDTSDLGSIEPNQFQFCNRSSRSPSIVGVEEFAHPNRLARA